MLSLVSSALLAIMMDRVLEIEWPQNKLCGFLLKELFVPKVRSLEYPPQNSTCPICYIIEMQ